jgi:hypothetical protein
VAVDIVSFAAPLLVAGLWGCARRFRRASGFIPVLFVTLVVVAMFAVPAAQGPQPLAPHALGVAMVIAAGALIDLMRPGEPPGHGEDGDDHGGGGGRVPRAPIRPRGGGVPPDSWEAFEDAYRAHVRAVSRERATEGAPRGGGE